MKRISAHSKNRVIQLLPVFLSILTICCHGLNAQSISPRLVGTNVWLNPKPPVWQQAADAKLQTIRIGGARYDRRLPRFEQLLTWVTQIKETGAEPVVQFSKYASADSAAALVRYLNIEHKQNVKYWGIGNEPWLQYERPPLDSMGAVIEAYWKPRAVAMKGVDPSIKIFGPNCCDYFNEIYDDLFGGKNDITGKVPGKDYYYCDGLTFHRYPQGDGNPGTEGADDIIERIEKAKKKIDYANTMHGRNGDEALGWGIGEYNSKGGKQVHTWGNGQMFGQVLGACMKYGATFATTWSMFEHGGSRTGTDFSMIDGNGTPRASYRHMEFIAKYFTGEYANGTSSSNNIKIFGASDENKVSVMIINREGGSQDFQLRLDNRKIEGEKLNLNVDAGKPVEYTGTIAEQSTQVLIFQQGEVTKWEYTSEDFDNDRSPRSTTASIPN
ncbi:MAG: hypothetical protein JXQ96_01530 [Cyclobacteriaceae bacterium]